MKRRITSKLFTVGFITAIGGSFVKVLSAIGDNYL
jgi:hypothetical protein